MPQMSQSCRGEGAQQHKGKVLALGALGPSHRGEPAPSPWAARAQAGPRAGPSSGLALHSHCYVPGSPKIHGEHKARGAPFST